MELEENPGYKGLTSAGVIAIHADWPVYATQHGWLAALAGLGMFPPGTTFTLLDDIDRCVLLLAEGISKNKDPFAEKNFHVALWHEDALDLARRGLVRGPVGVTEKVHQLNALLEIESRPSVASWPQAALDIPKLYLQDPVGESRMVDPEWETYDDESLDCLCLPVEAGLTVTQKGWCSLDEALSLRFKAPPSLRTRLNPMLDAGLYDTAVREVSVHLEHKMRCICGDKQA